MRKPKDCFHREVCGAQSCTSECERYRCFKNQLDLSMVPSMYRMPYTIYATDKDMEQYMTLDSFKKEKLLKFVEKGQGLYICSTTPGNAKTTWAIKIMLRYIDCTWKASYDYTRGLYINVPTFLLDIKKFDNLPEYISRITEADVVVWDDLAACRLTDYEHEQLYQYIDYRISNRKCNIYTSNIVDYETLKGAVGGRLASRIFNGSEVVEFKSDDFRVSLK